MFSSSSQVLPLGLSFPHCYSAVRKRCQQAPVPPVTQGVLWNLLAKCIGIGWEAHAADRGARAPSTFLWALSSDAAESSFADGGKGSLQQEWPAETRSVGPQATWQLPLLICRGWGWPQCSWARIRVGGQGCGTWWSAAAVSLQPLRVRVRQEIRAGEEIKITESSSGKDFIKNC